MESGVNDHRHAQQGTLEGTTDQSFLGSYPSSHLLTSMSESGLVRVLVIQSARKGLIPNMLCARLEILNSDVSVVLKQNQE